MLIYVADKRRMEEAVSLSKKINVTVVDTEPAKDELVVKFSKDKVSLTAEGMEMEGDFEKMVKRVSKDRWQHELLVKAARFKDQPEGLTLMDCTAGLGEDALLLAQAGFNVRLFERNYVIAALLKSALRRGKKIPELKDAISRMKVYEADSIEELKCFGIDDSGADANGSLSGKCPDVIYLDPMFPGRQKSALIKKKFQLVHQLETQNMDENDLLQAAIAAHPKKIVIKRPPKGPYLGGVKPGYSIEGKAVRFDCIILS